MFMFKASQRDSFGLHVGERGLPQRQTQTLSWRCDHLLDNGQRFYLLLSIIKVKAIFQSVEDRGSNFVVYKRKHHFVIEWNLALNAS